MNVTYDVDEFLANADLMDIVHVFWKFKTEIEYSKIFSERLKDSGQISLTDEELRQIAIILKKISQQDLSCSITRCMT